MKQQSPVAFLSYVHFDDEHDGGKITEFRKRLSDEVHVQTGREFIVFQDKNIEWGENWEKRIRKSLDSSTFLIPVITPNFFSSESCLEELEIFIAREKKLKRDDLILPMYYIDCPLLAKDNRGTRKRDKLGRILSTRQYFDWRELRFTSLTSAQVSKVLAQVAIYIRKALERYKPLSAHRAGKKVAAGRTKKSDFATRVREKVAEVKNRKISKSGPELVSSLAIKTEPVTLIVDQKGKGDYATIGDALRAAKPAYRVVVRPGIYKESLIITKPLEILADGKLGEVQISSTMQTAVTFKTSMGRFANFKIKHSALGNKITSAIKVVQGRVEIEGCDISSNARTVVMVDPGANPLLVRNRINTAKGWSCIQFSSGSLGSALENDISGGRSTAGILISESLPTLTRNRIHSCVQGILAYNSKSCVVEDNDIFSNSFSGVTLFGAGTPILRRNRIHGNKVMGGWVYDQSRAIFEQNEIFNNREGMQIEGKSMPVLRENLFRNNLKGGISVAATSTPLLEGNRLKENGLFGVKVAKGAQPILRNNVITKNDYGIWLEPKAIGTFGKNDLKGNRKAQWKRMDAEK